MALEIGDKIMVAGEECEVVEVVGTAEEPQYQIKAPDGRLMITHGEHAVVGKATPGEEEPGGEKQPPED